MTQLNFIGKGIADTLDSIHESALDITAPHTVEIQVREKDRATVWINVNGVCSFRACRMAEIKFDTPDHDREVRRSLVASLALVALHGLEQERVTAARIRNKDMPYYEWSTDPEVREVRRVVHELKSVGNVVHTNDRVILDRMAHTRQLAKLSFEEWEALIRIEPLLE